MTDSFVFVYSTDYSLIITLKVSLCLAFLIVIRGCIPRYRYDFLTKMG
jgi:NADH:ubiquinone oxidoreductase subunit H